MRILGLTGDIAAGKSTVAHLLEAKGAALVDADALVHELYADPHFAAQVIALFEPQFLDVAEGCIRSLCHPDGTIDRAALGTLVFRDAGALRRLEAVVHPAVAALRARRINELRQRDQPPQAVVIEAVKLLESGGGAGCDAIWWVRAAHDTQLQRLTELRGLSETGSRVRLASGPPPEAKPRLAGATPLVEIENDGTPEQLKALVDAEWKRFLHSST